MVNVGFNYGNKVCCPLCRSQDDTQEHLTQCLLIKLKCKEIFHMTEKYEDIFGSDCKKIIKIAKICESTLRIREELID